MWACIATLIVLAAGLRLYRLSLQSLWFDEWIIYFGLSSASLTTYLRNLFIYLGEMAVTPIYLSLAYIVSVFSGGNIVALRMLSIVPGILSLILLYLVGRRLGGWHTGLVAVLCLALSPQHIWHNQEIRPYSLLFMCCLLALLGLIYWRDNGRRKWFLLNFLANGMLIFSHLFGVLFLLPQGLYLLGRREYKIFVRWAVVHVVLILPLLLAILFKPHLSEAYHPDLGLPLAAMVFRLFPSMLLRSFCADVLRWHTGIWPWFESGSVAEIGLWLRALLWVRPFFDWALTLLLLGCISTFWFIGGRKRSKAQEQSPAIPAPKRADRLLVLSIIMVPSVILAALTLSTSANFSDYGHDIYATIGVYLSVGILFSRLSKRIFIGAVILLACLYAYQCLLFLPGATRSDWRSGATYIKNNAGPKDIVLDLWWNGPISRRVPYFTDSCLPVLRVNTIPAIVEEATRYFDVQGKPQEGEKGAPCVWLLAETRFWREWFPDRDLIPLLSEALRAEGLSSTVQEFPGGFNLIVMNIFPSSDPVPETAQEASSRYWTCDYGQLLYDIGMSQTDDSRRQEMLHTLERTIGVWPGVSAMGRVTYPLDLLLAGDMELAENMARYIVMENPSFGLGYLALAYVWAAQGEYQRATAAYQSACAHHLGLGYFFETYFKALCVDKDLKTARAALETVNRLEIPLFHETAERILEINATAQQQPKTERDTPPAQSDTKPLAPSSQQHYAFSDHPAKLIGVWNQEPCGEASQVWIETFFNRQEQASRIAQWLPFHKQVRGLTAEFLYRFSGDVNDATARYALLLKEFPFEKRFYEAYDRLLKKPDTPARYIQAWKECARYNPEIQSYAADKLARAGTDWYLDGNADAAIDAYTAACMLDAENTIYKLRLAQLYEFCAATEQALHWYGRALDADPNLPEILDRAAALNKEVTPQKAALFWKPLFTVYPDHWRIGMLYGTALEKAAEYETAEEVYRVMGQNHPGQADTHLAQSRCLRLDGELDAARNILVQSVAADASLQPLAAYEFIELGQAYSQKSDYAQAEDCFNTAIAAKAHEGLALFSLGEMFLKKGDIEKAVPILRGATSLEQENPWFRYVLAQAEERDGDITNAKSDYQKAVRMAPRDYAMAERLDDLLKRHGAPGERVQLWEKLVSEHPDSEVLRAFQEKANLPSS